ncbi:NAD(P)H-dependent nitrite reductase small subunit [Paenibacillus forsythiae]|uniref:NAD(P)H-dependent nitrite reductase small subunit n=1 Tax=Paenibacillus forsythiae TaxID=365616 RepID=A0ABU3H9C6_9BACL|nr:nitrite reductase small subunit NirD [Paenibacillus forsythiae]MDT3427437.1 NAD(P)H-dependent nitrite reductase small subunit [Paenibacillus forsythiae]
MGVARQTYPAGKVEEYLKQIGRVVIIKGIELAVFRTSGDEFYALENRNPHPKGGPLAEGIVSGHYLYDPLYDWKIDLRTGEVQAPDKGQAAAYPVHVDGDSVVIEI